jgi:hypothetical protein
LKNNTSGYTNVSFDGRHWLYRWREGEKYRTKYFNATKDYEDAKKKAIEFKKKIEDA